MVTTPPSLWRLFWRSFFPDTQSAYRRFSIQRLLVMLLFWPLFLTLVLTNRLLEEADGGPSARRIADF